MSCAPIHTEYDDYTVLFMPAMRGVEFVWRKINQHWRCNRINYQFVLQTRFTKTYLILHHLINPQEMKATEEKNRITNVHTDTHTPSIWFLIVYMVIANEMNFGQIHMLHERGFSISFLHFYFMRKDSETMSKRERSDCCCCSISIPEKSCDDDQLLIQFDKTHYSVVVFLLRIDWKIPKSFHRLGVIPVNKALKATIYGKAKEEKWGENFTIENKMK